MNPESARHPGIPSSRALLLPMALHLTLATPTPDPTQPLMMRFPDIHAESIVFSSVGDLWIAPTRGGAARRLTTDPDLEYFPKFSPDGKWVAYTGTASDSRWQVFVVSAAGGKPRQLTFYPFTGRYQQQVLDWTPDGKYVVFCSGRDSPFGVRRFFRVPADGGWTEPLPLSRGAALSYAPDGTRIAFTQFGRDFEPWKRYKGGRAEDVWLYDFKRDELRRITSWEGTDHHPMWSRDAIYFASDRTGTLNLYRYDLGSQQTRQVTDFRDWDVKWPSIGPGGIVFERAGGLYRIDLETERITPILVSIPYTRPTTPIDAMKTLETVSLAPGGDRAVATARGELFLVDVLSGDATNLTRSPGVRESDGVLSADGKQIAFISDESGTEELYVMNTAGEHRTQLTSGSRWILRRPVWSPDGRRIAVSDIDRVLYSIDVVSKEKVEIDRSGQIPIDSYRWSPDARWLTYSKTNRVDFTQVYLYDVSARKTQRISDSRYSNAEAGFDPDGAALFYLSRRDLNTLETSQLLEYNFSFPAMDAIYRVPLRLTPASPQPNSGAADLDLNGISDRVTRLAVKPGSLEGLEVGHGALFYLRRGSLCSYDLSTNQEIELLKDVKAYSLSPDGTLLLVVTTDAYAVLPATARPIEPQDVKTWRKPRLAMPRNDVAEWRQILREAWRWQTNVFFFEDKHGPDWSRVGTRYASIVDRASNRYDLNYLLEEMIGELSVGHLFAGGGDLPRNDLPPARLLGADFAPDSQGYFRIGHILAGESWNPSNRSPLGEPGVRAKVGDYVLEIDGQPLRAPDDPYQLLSTRRDSMVTLTLSESHLPNGAWKVTVRSIGSETSLRYVEWLEENRRAVARTTNDRVGYVHIPNFGQSGMVQFARQYYSQTDKAGLVIDGRYNTGGYLAEAALERLRRFAIGMNACKMCGRWTYPKAAFSGRQVLLINQFAVSDGDNFPYFYRKYDLGPIVGTRTWGTVVGRANRTLIDGGIITASDNAVTDLNLIAEVDNVGVRPDIDVENPANQTGRDAQLEKAIAVILDLLERKPVRPHPIPAPDR